MEIISPANRLINFHIVSRMITCRVEDRLNGARLCQEQLAAS